MNAAETGATPERRRLSDAEITELAAKVDMGEAVNAGVQKVLQESGHENQVGTGAELPIAIRALQTKIGGTLTDLVAEGKLSLDLEKVPGATPEEKMRNLANTLAHEILV